MTDESRDDTVLYRQILDRIFGPDLSEFGDYPILKNLANVMAFCAVNSTSWAIVTGPKRP